MPEIDKIVFTEEGHIYKSELTGLRYQSVTTEIHHSYVKPMNTQFWVPYKAFEALWPKHHFEAVIKFPLQNPDKSIRQDEAYLVAIYNQQSTEFKNAFKQKLYDIPNAWKYENDKANERGTRFHLAREVEDANKAIVKGAKRDIIGPYTDQYDFDLTRLNLGYRNEFLVYSKEALLCGRMDRNWLYRDGYFDIDDWKTNKEMKFSNPFQKMTNGLEHLDDCLFNHYKLQISLYAKLLSLWGYKPRHLSITYVQLHQTTEAELSRKTYFFDYMKDEVDYIYAKRLEQAKIILSGR